MQRDCVRSFGGGGAISDQALIQRAGGLGDCPSVTVSAGGCEAEQQLIAATSTEHLAAQEKKDGR